MELIFHRDTIKIKEKEFNILTPNWDLSGLFCCTQNLDYLTIFGDIESYNKLAYVFALMTREKQTMIYLPLRKHGLTEYLKSYQGDNSAKDVIVLHHSIQFNIKHWKYIRQILSRDEKFNCFIEEDIFPKIDQDYRIFHYRNNKDLLDVKNEFETIFLIGSPKVYGSIANDCKEFSEGEPDVFFQEYKYYHDHRHLDMYLRRWKEIGFSIDYYDKNLWES